MTTETIVDLRTALTFLETQPGHILRITKPVDPQAELSGIYRYLGAGTPVKPPTRTGPAVIFENVTGYTIPVVVGVLASRTRTALLLKHVLRATAEGFVEGIRTPRQPGNSFR